MELFKFFKRKADPIIIYDADKNSKELISDGILFEGSNIFIKWGIDIDQLSNEIKGQKERRTDRTIYHWGVQTILNGLKLNLTTIYWDHKAEGDFKKFNSIGFWSIGDKQAEKYIEIISSHLENEIGLPGKKQAVDSDILLEWKIKDIKLSLSFFERHAYKLHFEINKEEE